MTMPVCVCVYIYIYIYTYIYTYMYGVHMCESIRNTRGAKGVRISVVRSVEGTGKPAASDEVHNVTVCVRVCVCVCVCVFVCV